jgi:hypothetical protein
MTFPKGLTNKKVSNLSLNFELQKREERRNIAKQIDNDDLLEFCTTIKSISIY